MVIGAWAAVFILPVAAEAEPEDVEGCEVVYSDRVKRVDRFYRPLASAIGHYNDSSGTSTLIYSFTTTKTASSTKQVSATLGLGTAIFKVEANTSFSITETYAKGKTVGIRFAVPGKKWGYVQPKAEFRTFHVTRGYVGGDCKWHQSKDYGYYDLITAVPFFSSCVNTGPCSPKP